MVRLTGTSLNNDTGNITRRCCLSSNLYGRKSANLQYIRRETSKPYRRRWVKSGRIHLMTAKFLNCDTTNKIVTELLKEVSQAATSSSKNQNVDILLKRTSYSIRIFTGPVPRDDQTVSWTAMSIYDTNVIDRQSRLTLMYLNKNLLWQRRYVPTISSSSRGPQCH